VRVCLERVLNTDHLISAYPALPSHYPIPTISQTIESINASIFIDFQSDCNHEFFNPTIMPFNVSPTQSFASYGTISQHSSNRNTISNRHELLQCVEAPPPSQPLNIDPPGVMNAISRGINTLLRRHSSKTAPTEHSTSFLASPSHASVNITGNEVVATLVQPSAALTKVQLEKARRMKQAQCLVTTKAKQEIIVDREEDGKMRCPVCKKEYSKPKSLQVC